MATGFTIQTAFGNLHIEQGQLADSIRDQIAQHCDLEMLRADDAERQALAIARGAQP